MGDRLTFRPRPRPRKSQQVKPTMCELAYAAGFFDGEGAVMIWRRSGLSDKYGRPYHRLHVSFTQVDRKPLDWLALRFGGTISRKNANPGTNERPSWVLMLSSQAALEFLRSVYPFLVLKKERVDVAFRFQQLVAMNVKTGKKGWTSITDELWNKREECRNELMRLNKRGVA